jgi:hypothetical protein
MKIIEVPTFNEDGSIKATVLYTPEEAQALLQFATNFLAAAGMHASIMVASKKEDPLQQELPFND